MVTERHAYELMSAAHERPPEKLEDFELWLLNRAHRPDEFPDAAACADAWRLVKTYRAGLGS
jgi:hypothetical protein